jgi:hypothetical protein
MTVTARTTATTATIPTTPTTPTGPEPTFPSLAALVGEDALEAFRSARLGRDAYRRRLPDGVAGALYGWERLNRALAEHRLAPPRLRLEQAGKDVSSGVFSERRTRRGRVLHDLMPAALNARLREGATLILDAANETSAPLQALCAGLAGELLGSCQANLYAAWGTTQGFNVHWDDHDVFVVQVEGRKRWALYGITREAPAFGDRHAGLPPPQAPLKETVLEPGDMLYLPRGYWHAAVGLGEPTLHLTIGVTRKTGADFLRWLAAEANAASAVRSDLPLEQDDDVLGARLSAVIAAALDGAEPRELARRYRSHVEAALAMRPQLSLPDIGRGDDYPPQTRLTLAGGPRRLEAGDGAAVLVHRGVRYTLAPELAGPLAALASGEAIAAADLEAAVTAEDRPLVAGLIAEMVGRGVFVIGAA